MQPAAATTPETTAPLAFRVLVVDDDTDIRDLVGFKLEQAGYEVRTACDGAAALSVVEQWRPDLVVLDVAMPGLTGYEVCKRFRADAAMAAVPVVMLTARNAANYSTLGYMAGADLYLTKPFSPRELLDRVEALLTGPSQGFGDALLNKNTSAAAEPADPGQKAAGRWWRR